MSPRDNDSLLSGLSGEQAETVRRYLDERDTLMLLHGSLAEVERAESLTDRLQVFVQAIQRTGFARVVLQVRNASLDPTLIVAAGLSGEEELELRQNPAPGAVWRRRLALLEPYRISQSYYLTGTDPWIAAEFGGGLPSTLRPSDDPTWTPRDTLLVLLKARDSRILATLALDDPLDRRRPSLSTIRIVELFGQQIAYTIEQAQLVALAERRAERLQRLQEVGSMLARSLDVRETQRELARQVLRILPADGVVLATPDLETGKLATHYHMVVNTEQRTGTRELRSGVIAEAARLGRAVRVDDYASRRVEGGDVLDEGVRCASALAVPLRVGTRLLGVLAVRAPVRAAFSSEDEELLVTIASHAATALANAELYAESERERRQSEALGDVARAVGESLRLGEVLQLILRHATALLHAEGASLSLRESSYLHVVAAVGSASEMAGVHLPIDGSVSGRVLRRATPAIVNDARNDPDVYEPTKRMADVTRTLAVPLITATGSIGVLSVVNRDTDFADSDARILQRLADQVAVAIVHARLFEEAAGATREWRVAFDAIPLGLLVLDARGHITRYNQSAARMAALLPGQDLAGCDFHEAILGVTADCVPESPIPPALTGETGRSICRSQSRDRIFEIVASPHPSGGAVVTFEDVTTVHALEERHQRVIETAADAIVITDLDRKLAFANPAAHELLGRGADLIGMPVNLFLPPETQERVSEHERLGFAGYAQRYECVVIRKDGDRRIVSVTSAPLKELGRVTGIVATLHDITDERRAREGLTQSEARYRNLFDTASDAIYTVDTHGAFTSVNEATCRLIGAKREELLGRSLVPFIDSEAAEEVREHFRAALGGQSRRYECNIVGKTGRKRLVSVTNTPIRHGDKVIGVLGVARDVTEERAQAQKLAASEAKYTNLVESAADAIFTVDEEGRFTSVNRTLEKSTGRSRGELLGLPFTSVLAPQDRDGAWPIFTGTLRGERQRGEFRYVGRDGVQRFGSIITAPMSEGGRVTGALGVVRDVTDEKMLMEQLLQQEKLAAIGQLVSGVAHELNNPLAGVMAFSQLLLASPVVTGDQRMAAETIHQESKRAAKIVSNLLTFARQHPPERSATDLNQVVRDTVELRRYAIERDQVEFIEDLDPHLPLTWADPFQLQQVVLNLITNAEQAVAGTARRRIVVKTRADGGLIVVSVEDSGPGIEAADVDRIFNPFYTTKAVGQGTGLGLSISDGIVREHGGRIRVQSQPGEGARLLVELPLTLPPQRRTSGEPAGRSVLIVDPDPDVRGMLVARLGAMGHRVDTATSGAEGLAALRLRWYDAVLVDLDLPDFTGEELFNQLKSRDARQATRVTFAVEGSQTSKAHQIIRATGRACVAKPLDPATLSGIIFAEAAA